MKPAAEVKENMRFEALEVFNDCRAILLSLATRILGNQSEAEDMVQETYLRWQKAEHGKVRSPKAFLTTTVTRLCLNQLDLARIRLVHDAGSAGIEDLHVSSPGPDQHAELADALDEAFSRMLANLNPTERAVFLLREAFDFDYSEIAPIVERSEANCRQIHKRARGRIARNQEGYQRPTAADAQVVQVFRAAVETGELESLLGLLSEGAVLTRDGGDLTRPAPPPLLGPALREELRILGSRLGMSNCRLVPAQVLGEPLLLVESDSRTVGAFLFVVRGHKIQSIRVMTCPAMIRQLSMLLACQPGDEN